MRLAVLLLLACSGVREPEPRADGGPPDLGTTCSPQHDAVGPACVPRFDACERDALPKLGGGCEVVGDPGAVTVSEPTETCGTPPSDAVFVDGSYGGPSDGSSARPFQTVAAALAVASTTVWIGAGVYREDLLPDKPIALAAACPSKVTIQGVAAPAAITVRAGAVRGLSVTGPRRGITVDGAKGALVEDVRVHDTGELAIAARNGSVVTIRRAVIERATEAGIAAAGGTTTLADVVVRDIRAAATLPGDGILATGDNATRAAGALTVTRALIERVAGGGVSVQGSAVDVSGSIVRRAAFGVGHERFVIGTPSRIKVSSSLIEDTTGQGIVANQTALELDGVTVRRATLGVAIFGPHAGFLPSLRRVTVEHARRRGISVVDGGATLESVLVRGTQIDNGEGCGVCASPSDKGLAPRLRATRVVLVDNAIGGLSLLDADAEVLRALIARNGTLGVSVANGAAKLGELIVRDTRSRADGTRGDGILAAYLPGKKVTLTLEDALIDGNRNIGVAIFGDARVSRAIVRGTTPRPGGLYGFGLTAIPPLRDPRPGNLELDNLLVERNVSAGIVLGQSDLVLERAVVRDTATDAEGSFGDGIALTAGYRNAMGTVVVPSRATIASAIVERNARAGISVLGSALVLTNSRLRCNAVDLDVEELFDTATGARNAVSIADRGGNDCSCGPGAAQECRAQTTGLLPVPPAE